MQTPRIGGKWLRLEWIAYPAGAYLALSSRLARALVFYSPAQSSPLPCTTSVLVDGLFSLVIYQFLQGAKY